MREGQGVGVRARNGRAFVIGALAALGCGAVVMPIHHQMKPDELSDMLARAPLCAILNDGQGGGPDSVRRSASSNCLNGASLAFHAAGRASTSAGARDRRRRLRAVHFGHDRRGQRRGC